MSSRHAGSFPTARNSGFSATRRHSGCSTPARLSSAELPLTQMPVRASSTDTIRTPEALRSGRSVNTLPSTPRVASSPK